MGKNTISVKSAHRNMLTHGVSTATSVENSISGMFCLCFVLEMIVNTGVKCNIFPQRSVLNGTDRVTALFFAFHPQHEAPKLDKY